MRAKSIIGIIAAIFLTLLSDPAAYAQAPEVLWTKVYVGSGAGAAWQSQETQDGGFIITGSMRFSDEDADVYLIKTDENGDTLWTRTYGGASADEGRSVRQTADGGFTVVGFTESYGDYYRNVYLIKTDSDGDTIWTRTYGIMNSQEGRSVDICDDGGYIIAGWTGYPEDIYVLRTDSLGNEQWHRTYGGSNDERGWAVIQTSDGGYAVSGERQGDIYLTRLAHDETDIEDNDNIAPDAIGLLQNHPNPFNASTVISYELARAGDVVILIFDIAGRKIETLYEGYREAGEYSLTWEATDYSSGIYFVRLQAGEYMQNVKMVLLK